MAEQNQGAIDESNNTLLQQIGLGVILVALVAGGFFWYSNQQQEATTPESSVAVVTPTETPEEPQSDDVLGTQEDEETAEIEYGGEEGKTALELLRENADSVSVEESSFGEFVSGINGEEATQGETYWSFYVNGEPAQVGAGQYETENEDTISWKLEEIE